MAGPILYSTNPFFAHDLAIKYRGGEHVVWCSEYYDPKFAPTGSAASLIAPSSSPKGIYDALRGDCEREDSHSHLIKGYRKTFRRLAKDWFANGELTREQFDEIITTVNSSSWKIWKPLVYVIPRASIETAGRLQFVPRKLRASYGPELQIVDLVEAEFDIIAEW